MTSGAEVNLSYWMFIMCVFIFALTKANVLKLADDV